MSCKRGEVYPSWRYTAEGDSKLVHDAVEDDALGPEWDVPEAFADDAGGGGSMHDLSAKDAAALAADADLETAKALLVTEQAHPTKDGGRPSVIKAIEKRIAELTEA